MNNYLENRVFPPHPPLLELRLDLDLDPLFLLLDERLDRFFIVNPLNNLEKKPLELLVDIIYYVYKLKNNYDKVY